MRRAGAGSRAEEGKEGWERGELPVAGANCGAVSVGQSHGSSAIPSWDRSQLGVICPSFTERFLSGFPPAQVKIWFQNRRMKWRNSKERELLSSGGCREQTLPTKFNPHPDLSDVGKKCTGEEEEEEEAPTACPPSPRHPLSYHQSPEHLHLRDRLDSQLPPSPSHSSSPSKPSDFSDSEEEDDEGEEEEEEITVS